MAKYLNETVAADAEVNSDNSDCSDNSDNSDSSNSSSNYIKL